MTEQATPSPAPEAKAPVPRAAKLTLIHAGVSMTLLKYAFPVKAAKFPVKVNGAVVDAATTEGRGKAYTYLLINNTSFYVPGTLPVDAETKIDFPEGYKFDEAQAVRVSTYKPKAKVGAPTDPQPAVADPESGSDVVAETVEAAPAATAPKAARRGK